MNEQSLLDWQPPPRPEVASKDFAFAITPIFTGWSRDLDQPLCVQVSSASVSSAPPRAIQIPIRHAAIRVRSFQFPPPAEVQSTHLAPRDGSSHTEARRGQHAESACYIHHTRIRPPVDVIKLEDRLNYLLQPPLEALLSDRELAMPFRPFPFQFEGVAFLYPRHAAILADEMGLGKTMQAITAIRLLLHTRRGPPRAAGLSQAAGVQLAARVPALGARGADAGH